jgi:hypothetical protein
MEADFGSSTDPGFEVSLMREQRRGAVSTGRVAGESGRQWTSANPSRHSPFSAQDVSKAVIKGARWLAGERLESGHVGSPVANSISRIIRVSTSLASFLRFSPSRTRRYPLSRFFSARPWGALREAVWHAETDRTSTLVKILWTPRTNPGFSHLVWSDDDFSNRQFQGWPILDLNFARQSSECIASDCP